MISLHSMEPALALNCGAPAQFTDQLLGRRVKLSTELSKPNKALLCFIDPSQNQQGQPAIAP
jgi:hypothetical protein